MCKFTATLHFDPVPCPEHLLGSGRENEKADVHRMVPLCVLQPSGDAVSLLENMALISQGTTGLVTWEAALYLAEWALDHQEVFAGRYQLTQNSVVSLSVATPLLTTRGQHVTRKFTLDTTKFYYKTCQTVSTLLVSLISTAVLRLFFSSL